MSRKQDEEKRLTILQHLEELRRRLFHSVLLVAATTLLSFIFAPRIFSFLLRPAGDIKPVFIEVTEMVGVYFKVSLYGGLALAMPFLVYQLFSFVSPGLTGRERRWFYFYVPWVFLSFLAGITFAYFVVLPPALKFLLSFGSDIAEPQIRISNYISVITTLLFWVGVTFEMPVAIYFLARLGVVNSRVLARWRRWAILGAFVLGGIITPTFDPVNQSLVAGPLIVLYELSIWLAWLAQRGRRATAS